MLRLALVAALAMGAGGCALLNAADGSGGPDDPDDPVDPDDPDDEDDDPNAGGFVLKLGEDALDTPAAIAVRDIAGESGPDIAVLDLAAQRAHLFVNDGGAHFEDHAVEVSANGWLFAGTYLADGETMPGRDLAYVTDDGRMMVVDGDGAGGFEPRAAALAVAPHLMAPFADGGGGDGMLLVDTANAFMLLSPIGTGQFSAIAGPNPPPVPFEALRAADVDADGDEDVLMAGDDSAWVAYRDGDTLLPWDDFIDLGIDEGVVTDVAVGDFVGDDAPDVVVLVEGSDEALRVFGWNGDEYIQETELDPTLTGTSIIVGDADGDRRPDLFLFDAGAVGDGSIQVSVLLAGEDWDYSERVDVFTIPPHDAAVADFDGDGRDDFAVVSGPNADGALEVWCSRIPPPDE